ncbi:GNAT family N-acetyltransferase [Mucilaginibacter achroorhodeus]|uniref:GNAT family N-acetyltransferase n=1 Tax=Mucilaginibacter achroorhodeus TaxID=2599294 RepID=A0A563U994_9SPHI|nr:GNAT family N-acetyltransferase [Mucilaginibacter achroorhodeus]TWR27853.1 GNAT family N-acetyltransferase [Mucilaginibacter achroorhodeus]
MIRDANPNDAKSIVPLILLAMGPLATKFANSDDLQVQTDLFSQFVTAKDNQYSYQNILVREENGNIAGMIMAYDGAKLQELRKPFLDHIKQENGFAGEPEDETQTGEYYIDCLAVLPQWQGHSLGSKLIKAMCYKIKEEGHDTVGLLVSRPQAKRLYERLGFKVINEIFLLGVQHQHMQLRLS